jgi:pimeloyl-ACP methyl ester carboxylesterase
MGDPLERVPAEFYDETLALGLRPRQIEAEADEATVIPASLPSLAARLPEVRAPVTVVAGALDTHAAEQAPRLARDLPDATVVIVEGADHYLWYAYPDVVVQAMQDTWERADARQGP